MASPNQKFKDEQKSKSQGPPSRRDRRDTTPAPDRETILRELDTVINERNNAPNEGFVRTPEMFNSPNEGFVRTPEMNNAQNFGLGRIYNPNEGFVRTPEMNNAQNFGLGRIYNPNEGFVRTPEMFNAPNFGAGSATNAPNEGFVRTPEMNNAQNFGLGTNEQKNFGLGFPESYSGVYQGKDYSGSSMGNIGQSTGNAQNFGLGSMESSDPSSNLPNTPPPGYNPNQGLLDEIDALMNEKGSDEDATTENKGFNIINAAKQLAGFFSPIGFAATYGPKLFDKFKKSYASVFGDRPVGKEILEKLAAGGDLSTEEKLELVDLQKKLDKEEGFNKFSFGDSTYLNREIGDSTIGDLLSNAPGIVNEELLNKLIEDRKNNPELTTLQKLGRGIPEGYVSQSDIMNNGELGIAQLAALRELYPETYYGDTGEGLGFKPRSQRELEDLAAMDISAAKGNEGLVREIARARETLRREGREAPAGIASLAPVLPPASPPITTPSPGPGRLQPGPLMPAPTPAPVNPGNQYTQLGIPQVAPNLPGGFPSGNFNDYYNNLNQFFNRGR